MKLVSNQERERGSLSAFVAIVAIFFVAISVVLSDGARRLSNISRAEDLASEAARAAAATLDVGALATGRATIDLNESDGAMIQVEQILAASGDDIDFRIEVAEDRLSVRVDVIVQGTAMLPGFDIRGFGSHTARVIEPAALTTP
jgi:hypothetical protein